MLKPRLALVEAAWRLRASSTEWLRGLLDAFVDAVPDAISPAAAEVLTEPDRLTVKEVVARTPREAALVARTIEAAPAGSIGEVERVLGPGPRAYRLAAIHDVRRGHVGPVLAQLRAKDFLTLRTLLADGRTIDVTAAVPTARRLHPAEEQAWQEVAAHLDAAYRLRCAGFTAEPDQADVILADDGQVLGGGRVPDEGEREALARAVVDLRGAVVDGAWSIVEHVDRDGKRLYLAVENPPAGRHLRRLTDRERVVVDALATDATLKAVAARLAIDEASLSRLARSAFQRLGVRSRGELVLLFGALDELRRVRAFRAAASSLAWILQDLTSHPALARLTPAERALVPPLAAGVDDRTIAARRRVSRRTVANQTAAVFRKLAVNARHELAVLVARSHANAMPR